MFSKHNLAGRTEYAELLPLRVGKSKQNPGHFALKTMLNNRRYKRLFKRGSSFKVKALECGRAVNQQVEYPWNTYDMRLTELRDLLITTVYEDIKEIPLTMLRTLVPFESNKTMVKYKCYMEKVSGGLFYDLGEFMLGSGKIKLVD